MTNESQDRFRCDCGQSFKSKEELQQHQRTCSVAMRQQGGKTKGAGGGQPHQG